MPAVNCFDAPTLKDYLLGKLPDEQSDVISAHLEACLNCEATVAELDRASDTLTDGLRLPALAAEPATNDELQKVLKRVQSLEPAENVGFRSAKAEPFAERKATILRDYRLLEPLGSGGMGTVYKAVHTRLDRLVAVKLLPARRLGDEQAVTRFQREMRVIGQLSHPAIVQATDAGEVDGTHFLVMEFVEGFDLNTIAKACGPLAVADACEIARQAALGLEYAHQQGIVHRDIKPSNLMLSNSAEFGVRRAEQDPSNSALRVPHSAVVKILDLGLALLSGEQAPVDELTTVGQLMGTLDYMAPEQLEDSHQVGPRADIYALAATLYRLLTGVAPFAKDDRKTPLQKLRALATQTAPPIRERRADLPEELAAIIDRALRRDPDERFASMAEFAEALAPWCAGNNLATLVRKVSIVTPSSFSLSPWGRAGVREASFVGLELPSRVEGSKRSVGNEGRASARVPHLAFGHPLPGGEGQTPRRWSRVIAMLAFVSLITLGIVITIQTNKGTLIVESVRDGVEVRVKKSGKEVHQLELTSGPKSTRLAAGEYEIEIVGDSDGLQIQNGRFLLKRGDTVVAKIIEQPRVAASGGMSPTGVFQGKPAAGSLQQSTTPMEGDPVGTDAPFAPTTGGDIGELRSGGLPPPTGLPGMGTPRGEIVDRNAKGMESFEALNPDLAGEQAIRAKLLKPITVEFVEIPIADAVAFLADRTGVTFHLDVDALAAEGIASDLPVSLLLKEKPTTAVLEFLLRPMNLAWHIDGGQVVITTLTVEHQTLVTRMYPVGKLLPGVRQAVARLQAEPDPNAAMGGGVLGSGGGFFQVDPLVSAPLATSVFGQFGGGGFGGGQGGLGGQVAEPPKPTVESHFANLLEFSIVQPWMNTHGEGGSAELLHNVLMVRQSHAAHSEIESLLRTIEAAFLKPLTEPAEVRPAGYSLEADAHVRKQLARKIDVNFVETPLTDVASWLSDQLEVQVLIDQEALSEQGIAADTPVSLSFQGIAVDVLLQRILQPLQLSYDIEHGVLFFTTSSQMTKRLVTQVYDVREILDRGLHPSRLMAGLESTTPGPWMNVDDDGGTLFLFADTLLIVRQTGHHHVEVAKFLRGLHEAMGDQPVVPRATLPRNIPVVGATSPETSGPSKKSTGTTGSGKATVKSNVPRYDGKSFDECLAVLEVERSPVRLAEAFKALRSLVSPSQEAAVAQRALLVFRSVDPGDSYGEANSRRQIVSDANDVLNSLSAGVVQQAAANELTSGNRRSRLFVLNYVLPSCEVDPNSSSALLNAVLTVSRDNDESVRAQAVGWLARQAVSTKSIAARSDVSGQLRDALNDKAPSVAYWAAYGLLDSANDLTPVVNCLKRLIGKPDSTRLDSEERYLQGESIKLAAILGPGAARLAPDISLFLQYKPDEGSSGFSIGVNSGIRPTRLSLQELAALALARMGTKAASELPAIEAALKSVDEAARAASNETVPFGSRGSRSFDSVMSGMGTMPGSGRGGNQITFRELLVAAKMRLEGQPLPALDNRPAEVTLENTVPLEAMFKLISVELSLLWEFFGSNSARPEIRELLVQSKIYGDEFSRRWNLYNEQRKKSSPRS